MYSEGLTCEVLQAELAQSERAAFAVVEEDGEGVAVFVEPCTTDDAQVLKRQIFELIQSHQHITRHLPDGLERKLNRKRNRYLSTFTYYVYFWAKLSLSYLYYRFQSGTAQKIFSRNMKNPPF